MAQNRASKKSLILAVQLAIQIDDLLCKQSGE
jgi:hypothetical protein